LDNCTNIGWFIIEPTQDTVFNNHDDNLTIYCYEGSKIAEYAIATNIKYVYLTKPASDTSSDEDKETDNSKTDTSTTTTPTSDTNATTTKKNNTTTEKNDTTTASSKLPYTGVGLGIVATIIAVFGICIFICIKYRKYKDI
jgi:hypothetical protein